MSKPNTKKLKAQVANITPSKNEKLIVLPKVAKDARFRAGRTLVQNAQADKAITIFGSLLEEARRQFGEVHFETCPAYYEYGNSLFRFSNRIKLNIQDGVDSQQNTTDTSSITSPTEVSAKNFKDQMREAAATAAIRRANSLKNATSPTESNDEKMEGKDPILHENVNESSDINPEPSRKRKTDENNKSEHVDDETNSVDNDIQLSLEMMEIAWAILDECQQNKEEQSEWIIYNTWIQQQIPRVLTGIGDVLSSLDRHADAADAYSRALGYRQNYLESYDTNEKETVSYLTCRRLIVESNILIAEELLACPHDQDVITTESKAILVRASEGVVDYARGYYDKARDELQETVLLMGQLTASGIDIEKEKEDICFVATMVMGVGTMLAEIDEQNELTSKSNTSTNKKLKSI